MIDFQFLGTSAGAPTAFRNATGLALKFSPHKKVVLVDCGEGTQHQLLKSSFTLAKVSHILITHLHGDHVFGLPGLISTRTLLGVKDPLTVYGPKGIEDYITQILFCSHDTLSYPLKFVEIESSMDSFEIFSYQVTPISLEHNLPCFAYKFEERQVERHFNAKKALNLGVPKGPLFQKLKMGETISLDDGRVLHGSDFLEDTVEPLAFIVGGDNAQPKLLEPYLTHVNLLIHEATFLQEDFDKIPKKQLHSTVESLTSLAEKVQIPNLVMTHFSPRYHDSTNKLVNKIRVKAKSLYKGELFLAEDLARYQLKRNGKFVSVSV